MNLPGGPSGEPSGGELSGAPPSNPVPPPSNPVPKESLPSVRTSVPQFQTAAMKPKLSDTKDERKANTTENLKEEIKMVGINTMLRICAGNWCRVCQNAASRESSLFV